VLGGWGDWVLGEGDHEEALGPAGCPAAPLGRPAGRPASQSADWRASRDVTRQCARGAPRRAGRAMQARHLERERLGGVVRLRDRQVDRVAAAAQHVGLCKRRGGRGRAVRREARVAPASHAAGGSKQRWLGGRPCGWRHGWVKRLRAPSSHGCSRPRAPRGDASAAPCAHPWCRSGCCWARSSRAWARPSH
jgi:hypothetical protein